MKELLVKIIFHKELSVLGKKGITHVEDTPCILKTVSCLPPDTNREEPEDE